MTLAVTLLAPTTAHALHTRYHFGTSPQGQPYQHQPPQVYQPRVRPWEPRPGDSLLRTPQGDSTGRSLLAPPPAWRYPPPSSNEGRSLLAPDE